VKNTSDTIGNLTRDLPGCSAVPQLNAPPRATICNWNTAQWNGPAVRCLGATHSASTHRK